MKPAAAIIVSGILCFSVYGQIDTSKSQFWMMTYFRNDLSDELGAYLAFSSDSTGIRWQKYLGPGDNVVFNPGTVPGANDNKCRDPMIWYEAVCDSFHMIWTVSWTGTLIGYSSSQDLKTWRKPIGFPVGQNIANCSVCWAPEIYWDDIQNQWMVYWSTNQSGGDKHIYYVLTDNIRSLTTAPTPEMLFNPGYTVIDACIFKYEEGSYYMVFKDERDGADNKDIHYVVGPTPQGPWGEIHAKTADYGTEGPCLVKQGNEYHCYFDPYGTTVTYQMTRTTDINTSTSPWADAGPLKYWTGGGWANFRHSHCHVIEIPKKYVLWMLYDIPLDVVDVKVTPVINQVSDNGKITSVKLFDLSGRMVAIERIVKGNSVSSCSSIDRLPAGLYINMIESDYGRLIEKVLIRKK